MLNTKSTAVLSLLLPRTWRVSSACRGDNLCSKRVLYTFACSYGGVRKPQLASPFPFSARAPPRSKLTRVQANASYTMERETGTLLPGRAQASETTEFAKSFRNAGDAISSLSLSLFCVKNKNKNRFSTKVLIRFSVFVQGGMRSRFGFWKLFQFRSVNCCSPRGDFRFDVLGCLWSQNIV